jgi:glycosyltransferase involved in cell wall biosynthesis
MKIAFFTEPKWAFGSIHTTLCKQLHKVGITGVLLSWEVQYTPRDWELMDKTYDVFVTSPCMAATLLKSKGIHPSKIVVIAHGRTDFHNGVIENHNWDEFKNVAAISPMLIQHAKELGIDREVKLVQNGIDFDFYYQPPATELKRVGYGGVWSYVNQFESNDNLKRPHLAHRIVDRCNVEFVTNKTLIYFLSMPGYYSEFDCLIMPTNTQEACGLPVMEAAAAGRMVLSASVGIVDHLGKSPGVILPLEDDKFVDTGCKVINFYQNNPSNFAAHTKRAQEFAREYYDWSKVIQLWIDAITK